jgi:DNA invertase Pin-like site-specific DNA recombinase
VKVRHLAYIQKLGTVAYTYAEELQPAEFVEETTSGKTPISERKLLQVIDSMTQCDTLIVSELSRLGRNMVEVMTVLDQLVKKGCKVHAVNGGYRLDGTLSSKIINMVLLMAAEIERQLISQRTKEALARRKAEGKQLGRPKGSHGVSKLDLHEDDIRKKLLSHGVAKAAIARMYGSSWQTVHAWVRRHRM